ncbi:PTS sugar transporter subunit IIB [Merdibacter massiliensis]|uniref:PTS sugar transporter subunit IIB n=1 Tax=Merdibacter massiliensis TaxID=1871030 RepID=UPI00096AA6BB|nr:PTS sugar transporter subunit IIB [Merdibacter massiliensis]
MIRILLACGVGMSSGFMASSMRKSAKKQKLEVTVKAVSKAEVMSHEGEFDILLLGPHFAKEVPGFQKAFPNVKVSTIDPDLYATLDGEGILKEALQLYES